MTIYLPPVCTFCKHFRGDRKCSAFPDGIPDDIWDIIFIHTDAYEGDNGTLFEPLPEYRDEALTYIDALRKLSEAQQE